MKLHLDLICRCGHTWTLEAIHPMREADGSYHGFFGSDADFCPKCDRGGPTATPRLEPTMKLYRLTGNYGTFEITKVGEYECAEDAWIDTGIALDLEAVGWTVSDMDGEWWDVEEVT